MKNLVNGEMALNMTIVHFIVSGCTGVAVGKKQNIKKGTKLPARLY